MLFILDFVSIFESSMCRRGIRLLRRLFMDRLDELGVIEIILIFVQVNNPNIGSEYFFLRYCMFFLNCLDQSERPDEVNDIQFTMKLLFSFSIELEHLVFFVAWLAAHIDEHQLDLLPKSILNDGVPIILIFFFILQCINKRYFGILSFFSEQALWCLRHVELRDTFDLEKEMATIEHHQIAN